MPIMPQQICGPILEIYKSVTDTCMWKFGLRPRNSQKRNTKWDFRCSVVHVCLNKRLGCGLQHCETTAPYAFAVRKVVFAQITIRAGGLRGNPTPRYWIICPWCWRFRIGNWRIRVESHVYYVWGGCTVRKGYRSSEGKSVNLFLQYG